MYYAYKSNKKLQTKWDDFEDFESEPRHRQKYDLSPELEDELLDNSYFLKARVRRNMRRIRRQNAPKPEPADFHGHLPKIYRHA